MTKNDGYDFQQLKCRAQHEALVWERTRVLGTKTAKTRLRTVYASRLMAMLNGDQERAYYQIEAAFRLLTAGMGVKITNYAEPMGRATADPEAGADLLRRYSRWSDECARYKLSRRLALDVICGGLTLREAERAYKFTRRTARKNLLACLDLWWRVR